MASAQQARYREPYGYQSRSQWQGEYGSGTAPTRAMEWQQRPFAPPPPYANNGVPGYGGYAGASGGNTLYNGGFAANSSGENSAASFGFSHGKPRRNQLNAMTILNNRFAPVVACVLFVMSLYLYTSCRAASNYESAGINSLTRNENEHSNSLEQLMSMEGMSSPKQASPVIDVSEETIEQEEERLEDKDASGEANEKLSIPAEDDQHGVKRSLLEGRHVGPEKWPSGAEILGRPYAKRVIVDRENRMLYCPIPTAASSNWKYLMRKFAGHEDYANLPIAHNNKLNGFKFLSDFSGEEVEGIMNDKGILKFTFVRHPYYRVLSAYINKYLSKDVDSHEYNIFMGHLYGWDWLEKHEIKSLPRPTFDEFLQAISSAGDDNNEHWGLETTLCGIGHFPYDIVGKLDQVEQDSRIVLEAVGRGDEKFPTQQDLSFPSSGTEQRLQEFLTPTTQKLLSKRFEEDLRMLGYPDEL